MELDQRPGKNNNGRKWGNLLAFVSVDVQCELQHVHKVLKANAENLESDKSTRNQSYTLQEVQTIWTYTKVQKILNTILVNG